MKEDGYTVDVLEIGLRTPDGTLHHPLPVTMLRSPDHTPYSTPLLACYLALLLAPVAWRLKTSKPWRGLVAAAAGACGGVVGRFLVFQNSTPWGMAFDPLDRLGHVVAPATAVLVLFVAHRLATSRVVRESALYERSFRERYGWLFLRYRRECYLWEVWIMARKLLIGLAGLLLQKRPVAQGVTMFVIVLAGAALQWRHSPFVCADCRWKATAQQVRESVRAKKRWGALKTATKAKAAFGGGEEKEREGSSEQRADPPVQQQVETSGGAPTDASVTLSREACDARAAHVKQSQSRGSVGRRGVAQSCTHTGVEDKLERYGLATELLAVAIGVVLYQLSNSGPEGSGVLHGLLGFVVLLALVLFFVAVLRAILTVKEDELTARERCVAPFPEPPRCLCSPAPSRSSQEENRDSLFVLRGQRPDGRRPRDATSAAPGRAARRGEGEGLGAGRAARRPRRGRRRRRRGKQQKQEQAARRRRNTRRQWRQRRR